MNKKREFLLLFASLTVLLLTVCSDKSKLADAHFQKGLAFENANRPDSALAQYRQAIQTYPKHVKANMAYQDLASENFGKEDEVWESYEMSAKKHPRDPVYQVLFARLLENNDDKLETVQRIVDRHPDFFWGHYVLGLTYYGYQDRDYGSEGIEAFERAVKIDPTETETYRWLANLSGRANDYKKSKEYIQKALALDSTRIDLYPRFIWEIEYRMAANKDSIKKVLLGEIDRKVALHGHDLRFLTPLWGMLRDKDKERAQNLEKEIASLDPKGEVVQSQALDRVQAERDPKEGMEKAKAILDAFPEGRYSLDAFSSWLRFARQVPGVRDEEVNTVAKKLLDSNPQKATVYSGLYNYFSKKYPEDHARLERLMNQQLDATGSRKRFPVLNTLAQLYLKQNRFDDALQILLQADSLSRRYRNPSPSVCGSLGEVYQKKGDLDKALEYYSQSIGLGDNDTVLENFYSAYEKKFGSREGARKFINQKVLNLSALKKPFPAPEFALNSVTDQTIRSSDLRGKVVLVSIWSFG